MFCAFAIVDIRGNSIPFENLAAFVSQRHAAN